MGFFDFLGAAFPVWGIANGAIASGVNKAAGGGGNSEKTVFDNMPAGGGQPAAQNPYPGNDGPGGNYMGNPDLAQYGPNPFASGLSGFVASQKPLSYTGGTYKAKDMSTAALPQYDAIRDRISSQYSQTQSQGQDAIDRQFAAMGGGPGNGAQAKQTENLVSSIAKQKGSDLEGVAAQEAEARTGLQQQEAQKEYQSQEAARGYGFQAAEANRQFGLNANSTLAQLNTAWTQSQAESKNNEFNKALAQFQAQHSGGLLGGGGWMGLGI